MTSEKQKEANRKNALKSTGSKTVNGKASSRKNAYKHGLTAEKIITLHEDAADFEALRDRIISELSPGSQIEQELSERIASVLLRLRRVPQIEAGLFVYAEATALCLSPGPLVTPNQKPVKRDFCPTITSPDELKVKDEDGNPKKISELIPKAYDLPQARLAEAFKHDGKAGDAIGKLSHYENLLMRQFEQNLELFHKLKATRIEHENIIDETAVLNGHANGKTSEADIVDDFDDLEDPGF